MSSVEDYRQALRSMQDWDDYLLPMSGLPGPRANLALVLAVADEGDEARFRHLLSFTPEKAPTNSPQEFLALCGVVGLGRLLAEGRSELLETLRGYASDPRWRMREGVAMALQRLGDRDMDALIRAMAEWSTGNPLEQRAAAAALCEPRLLSEHRQIGRVLDILDSITTSMTQAQDRRDESFKALRKAMGYCWSVAVVAWPQKGKRRMERWFVSPDKDVRWVMRENLGKARLTRMDSEWVERSKAAYL